MTIAESVAEPTRKPKQKTAAPKKPKGKKNRTPMALPDYNFGATIDDSIFLFTKTVVHQLFMQAAKQQLRDFLRSKPMRKASPEEIATALQTWKPVVKRRGKSAVEKAARFVAGMTAAEKAELQRMLSVP